MATIERRFKKHSRRRAVPPRSPSRRTRVAQGAYGVVYVRTGTHAGRVGWYETDPSPDTAGRVLDATVAFGPLADPRTMRVLIERRRLRRGTPAEVDRWVRENESEHGTAAARGRLVCFSTSSAAMNGLPPLAGLLPDATQWGKGYMRGADGHHVVAWMNAQDEFCWASSRDAWKRRTLAQAGNFKMAGPDAAPALAACVLLSDAGPAGGTPPKIVVKGGQTVEIEPEERWFLGSILGTCLRRKRSVTGEEK